MWICLMVVLSQLVSSGFCQLDGWESLGCWRDLPTRAIASLEGKSKLLGDNWKQRANPLNACAEAAKDEKLKVFAVQDGGQCFGGPYAHIFYDQYGPSNLCKGGVGGVWSSNVYSSKIAYTRVLESKKENEKLVKCSKPLDMIFLVDGSGDSNMENKLRWDQMLKFISKATEHFDSPSTRFGVISYGSQPKTIVNIHDNKDEISMRDSIISANFPGGPRTINEALKKAWKEQLKYTERGRNKVIAALTASSMDYGPWGSSLFLTNRGVRLLSMGIDKAPSYRYLESLASGKHPENIYSIDSEQLDATLPYFAKDVCTGFKKSKIETVKKDKEIDFISSQDFETVGSVVERKYAKGRNKTSNSVNSMNEKSEKDDDEHDKKVEINEAEDKKENKKTDQKEEKEDKKENQLAQNINKGTKQEISSSKPDDFGNLMSIGSYERTKEDDKTDGKTARKVFPVNNSSLSDGDIVEKLKESAVEVLTNTENFVAPKNSGSIASSGKPMIRELSSEKNETKEELKAQSGHVTSSNYKGVNRLKTRFHARNATNTSSITSFEKVGNAQKHESYGGPQATERKMESNSSLNYKKEKSYEHRDASNKTLADASNEGTKKAKGKAETNKKPWKKESNSHFLEGQSTQGQKENFGNDASSEFNSTPNATSYSDKVKSSNSNLIPESAISSIKSGKKPNNESQSSSEEHGISNTRKDGEKDLDREIFDGLQQQRESIGQGENDNDDEAMINEIKSDHDLENYSDDHKETSDYNFTGENVPDDEITIDEDERVTQTALEQKRREIDILLKKLDETRRRRRRRKVRQRSKDSRDEEGIENFSEGDNENNGTRRMGEYNGEGKEVENGMETGMKRRFHQHTYSDPQSRHFLLITQNDSKPFPVQRPFKTVPTAKAFKLLDKLYSYDNKQNMKLKYDIFDPTYSSRNSKVMKNSDYKKFKKRIQQKPHRMHEKAKIMSTNKYQKEASDKQQFFLRNGISSKAGQKQNSNKIGYRNQLSWRSENANKKHIIKSAQSKNMKRLKNSKKATIDIKKVLDQYYAYFLKEMQPFWNYGYRRPEMAYLKTSFSKHNQSLSDRNSLRRVESQKTENNDSAVNQQTTTIHNASDGSRGHRNATSSMNSLKNFTVNLKQEYSKKKDISVNVVRGSKAINATIFGIRPMSFKSLDSIDSGNYTVYRFSKNDILINVQSKTGELLTFYGKSPEKIKKKKKKKRKHRKQSVQNLSNSTAMGAIKKALEVIRHRGDAAIKRNGYHTTIRPIETSRATNLVDNLKYFQSSLQEEPGIARGLKKAIVRKGKQQQISADNNYSHAGSNSVDINSNLTSYDVYDNRLAHVERQRQYFNKNRPDPDRLVITENNDPDTDSSTVKLFVNAGDENSLMPTDSVGINSHKEEKAKNMLSGMSDDFSEKGKWNKYVDSFAEDDDSKYNILAKNGEDTFEKTWKGVKSSKEEATGKIGSSRQGLKKIVEKESNDKRRNDQKQIASNMSQNFNGTARNQKEEINGLKAKYHNGNKEESGASYKSGNLHERGRNNTDNAVQTVRLSNSSLNHTKNLRQKETKGDRKESTNDEVWIFRPDYNKDKYREKYSKNFEGNKSETKKFGPDISNSPQDGKVKSEKIQSQKKEEAIPNEGLVFSRINQELGCTKPVAVLYAIDVSDAIGTGPTRQRKWNHMKRFLRSVNEKVIHGGSMGYIVYDTEPRFLSNLEPCDEKTEYFVTSSECLCDRKAASFREGKSSCSTHAPTEDESIEDWGKQGPRTAKALNYAEEILKNETLGDSKKLVVLVTHEASTDDVTGAERSLKDNSISLVDIEIGERHNIKKRSNRFDDVIPRDHQMEVSFYKLDKAIENIFTKICREKDPMKTRRSKIFARLRKHKNWW